MRTIPEPVEIAESFNIRWMLDRVREDKTSCFYGRTLNECEGILLKLLYEGHEYITTANGQTVAV